MHLQSADMPIRLRMSPDRLILPLQDSGVDKCRSERSGRNLTFTLVWRRESRRRKPHHSPSPGCRSRQVARPEPSPKPTTSRMRRDEGSSSVISQLIIVLTAGLPSVSRGNIQITQNFHLIFPRSKIFSVIWAKKLNIWKSADAKKKRKPNKKFTRAVFSCKKDAKSTVALFVCMW